MRFSSLAAVLVAAPFVLAPASSATRSKDIDPYETFKFKYDTRKPATATSLTYRVALKEQGAEAPVVKRLDLTFAKGTKVALGAVEECAVTDADIQATGPDACPEAGRIATGTAKVYIGGDAPLELDATVSPTGQGGIVAILATGDTVVRVLRGTFKGSTLTVKIPKLEINGTRVALVAFSLDIGGGTAKKPVFRTPKKCTKKGWNVVYAPTFVGLGKVRLVDTKKCRKT